MIDVTHQACGQTAIRMRRMLQRGQAVESSNFEHLDGRPVAMGEKMVCDSCGEDFSRMLTAEDGTPEAV